MSPFAQLRHRVRRFRQDRRGGALLGWACIGALVAGLVAWSVDLAERESLAHATTQSAW